MRREMMRDAAPPPPPRAKQTLSHAQVFIASERASGEMRARPVSLLVLLLSLPVLLHAQAPAPSSPSSPALPPLPSPVPVPARPAPFFSWDVLPRAFHGANRSGLFTAEAIAALSAYSMVTLEKWYTPCASQGPAQGNASCAVEDKMFAVFRALKALDARHTTIIYLNSMFNFAFYRLAGLRRAARVGC